MSNITKKIKGKHICWSACVVKQPKSILMFPNVNDQLESPVLKHYTKNARSKNEQK